MKCNKESRRKEICYKQQKVGRLTGLVTFCVIEGKIEGRIEGTGRRGRRRKQLLDNLNEK